MLVGPVAPNANREVMKLNRTLKGVAVKLAENHVLNPLLRKTLKPVSSVLPKRLLHRIPAIGLVSIAVSPSKKLHFQTDGHDTISTFLFWEGVASYESETTRVFLELLKHAKTFFDVGANTGIYALLAAVDDPRRQVYAFEPVPKIFDCLRENVRINKLKNLHAYPSAVTSYDGTITLYVSLGDIPLESSTLEGFRNDSSPISVEALTIDSFVTSQRIEKVDLMKVDTEATEHKVLEGARHVLERDQPIIICEVLKGRTETFLHELLDNTTYRFFLITDKGLQEKQIIEGDHTYKNKNYLFVPQNKIHLLPDEISVASSALTN